MNRFGAFAVHLGISLVIFAVLGYVILYHWYPDFFFASDGGWQGIRIVAFVDLVLGPTLTLVVFNRAKPRRELQRDLSIIGFIQLSCLTAGVWIVYQERPVAIVFSDGAFTSMTAANYESAGQPVPDFSAYPGRGPRWISVRLPEDSVRQSEIRRNALQTKTPIIRLTDYYVPFEVSHINRRRDGIPIDRLLERDREMPFIEKFLADHPGALSDYTFIPFGTSYGIALMALSRDGQIDYVPLPTPAAS